MITSIIDAGNYRIYMLLVRIDKRPSHTKILKIVHYSSEETQQLYYENKNREEIRIIL